MIALHPADYYAYIWMMRMVRRGKLTFDLFDARPSPLAHWCVRKGREMYEDLCRRAREEQS